MQHFNKTRKILSPQYCRGILNYKIVIETFYISETARLQHSTHIRYIVHIALNIKFKFIHK